jgi:hypothetical protein
VVYKFCGLQITVYIKLHEGSYLHFTETTETVVDIIAY